MFQPVSEPERKQTLVLKSFAVLFIVWGHHFGTAVTSYLYSFSVPLLFFIAGMEIHDIENYGLRETVRKLGKRILAPYFLYSAVLYFLWFVLIFLSGKAAEKGYKPLKQVVGIFYSQGMGNYMDWGMHMWYFPALFLSLFLAIVILKNVKRTIPVIVLSLVIFGTGVIFSRVVSFPLPWSLNIACAVQFFIILGHYVLKIPVKRINLNEKVLSLVVLLSLGYIVQQYNIWVDLKQGVFGNILFFLSSSICSLSGFFLLSDVLKNLRVPAIIGGMFTWIFVFHLRLWTLMNVVLSKVWPGFQHQSSFYTLVISLLQIFLIVGMVAIIKQLFRLMERRDRKV